MRFPDCSNFRMVISIRYGVIKNPYDNQQSIKSDAAFVIDNAVNAVGWFFPCLAKTTRQSEIVAVVVCLVIKDYSLWEQIIKSQ